MIEALVVFGLLGLFMLAGLLAATVSWQGIVLLGATCTVAGIALGFPTGFYYHVVLRHELLRSGELPKDWWLHPTRYHRKLTPPQRARVMPWFVAGGGGFMLIVLGALVILLGGLKA